MPASRFKAWDAELRRPGPSYTVETVSSLLSERPSDSFVLVVGADTWPEIATWRDGGNIHTYRRMIHHMDEGIGALVAALRAQGLLDNTPIVFTSDNGGERYSDNWPLVGGKMDLTEGGIRVPWIAHWPRVIPAGSTSTQHCMTMDWSATLLDVGGARPSPDFPIDDVSLARILEGRAGGRPAPAQFRANGCRRDHPAQK